MMLRVRALLLSGRIEEARADVEDWMQRTGDTTARDELEAMIRELQRTLESPDSSATAPEEGP
jgi:hypothetical protein